MDTQIQDIYARIEQLQSAVLPLLDESGQSDKLRQLAVKINSDIFTVVVVGEFKRGKSTFINALLGEELLPMDVTPTTAAIHALMWNATRELEVHYNNGEVVNLACGESELRRFSASDEFDCSDIRYIKVMLPAEMLMDRVVFVDTPGVYDLNQQRSEVTYSYIPQADAVLFLLDSTSPVKRTEREFLAETLLKEGLDRIVFIGNFIDMLDEDELDSTLEECERRLAGILGYRPKVWPLSSSQALRAKKSGDQAALRESGLQDIEQHLKFLIRSGTSREQKLSRYRMELLRIMNQLLEELHIRGDSSRSSAEELDSKLIRLDEMLQARAEKKHDLDAYVTGRQTEMLLMVNKSLDHLGEQMLEQLQEMVQIYRGPDLKDYVELQLPIYIRRMVKAWIEERSGQLQYLLHMLESRLSEGLSREFQQLVKIQSHSVLKVETPETLPSLKSQDISNTSLKAGAIVGGAGVVAMLMGASVVLPIVGLAGMPFLSKMMLDNKLKEVKQQLRTEIPAAVDEVMANLKEKMNQAIVEEVSVIYRSAITEFQERITFVRTSWESERGRMSASRDDWTDMGTKVKEASDRLLDWIQELEAQSPHESMASLPNQS